MNVERDPIINVIYNGFKAPVKLCMENGHERAALTLMYASIDAMAKLGMPETEEKSSRKYFNEWCEKYLVLSSGESIKGIEWFAARSGLIHNYTAESGLSKDGKARMIGYYRGEGSDVKYAPSISEEFVIIKIDSLIKAYYDGIDRFIVDIYAKIDHGVLSSRFNKMFHELKVEE